FKDLLIQRRGSRLAAVDGIAILHPHELASGQEQDPADAIGQYFFSGCHRVAPSSVASAVSGSDCWRVFCWGAAEPCSTVFCGASSGAGAAVALLAAVGAESVSAESPAAVSASLSSAVGSLGAAVG